ncbi:MAG: hypothetical protein LBT02_03015, partial [Rickettsiales bacterium]|nr:hypothetical protein [Rickettsiales bacterium]
MVLNKKTLIYSAVALSIANSGAQDFGIKFGGGVGGRYVNNKTENTSEAGIKTTKTTNDFQFYRARIKAIKDFGNGVQIYGQVDGSDGSPNPVALNALSLNYKVDNNLSVSLGKNFYGITSAVDYPGGYANSFTGNGGSLLTADYIYGGSINYNADGLNVYVSGGTNRDGDLGNGMNKVTDIFDVEEQDNNDDTKIKIFGGKKKYNTKASLRLDYTINGINVGVGYQYKKVEGADKILGTPLENETYGINEAVAT